MITTASSAAQERLLASLGANPGGRGGGRPGVGEAPPLYDPVQAYLDQLVTSPHLLLLGEPGMGKSTVAKTVAARLLPSTGDGPRHLGVLDSRGEYRRLAQALGLDSVRLYPGGPHVLNPLDAGPGSAGFEHEDVLVRRKEVVGALCAMKLRRPLTAVEHWALEAVVNELPVSATGPQPVLADVARLLASPTEEMAGYAEAAPLFEWAGVDRPVDVVEDGRDPRRALGQLLDGELRGTFDAATTVSADGAGPGVVVNLSSFHAGHSFAAVSACAWLEAATVFAEEPGDFPRRYNIVDDAWLLMGDEHASRYLASFLARSTTHGVANLVITHRLDDLRCASTKERTMARAAQVFVESFGTRVLFRDSICEIDPTASALRLAADEAGAVANLSRGQALWHVGGAPGFFVRHELGPDEWALCDDHAMRV